MPEMPETGGEWSGFFQRLISVFHAINTHLTFLSAHSRAVIPSVKLLQSLNESITTADLAIFKCLFPEDEIYYDYVDENQIMLSFVEEVKVDQRGYVQTSVADKFEDEPRQSKQILVFDFQDVKIHGIGKVIKGNKRMKTSEDNREYHTRRRQNFFLSSKENVLAPLKQIHITKIIQGRDGMFQQSLKEFVQGYRDQNEAEAELKRLAQDSIPEEPELKDMVEVLQSREDRAKEAKSLISVDEMITALKESRYYVDQISSVHNLCEGQDPQYRRLSRDSSQFLHPELKEALLSAKGISIEEGLYTHQAEALESLLDESDDANVILSTSTASGKSLVYQLPILNSILWNITNGLKGRHSTAFFIFPTKALAQDQIRHFQTFLSHLPLQFSSSITVNTFDGDTPFPERAKISRESDILFTNPDTIHASILPNHHMEVWSNFIKSLKFVVMDELHVYKGTFGINVGYVMARLLRLKSKLCHEDKQLRFVSCSATIANPVNHFKTVCSLSDEAKVIHIANDGSAKCEKKLIVWNPPVLMNNAGEKGPSDSNSAMIPRVSAISESAKLLLTLLTDLQGLRVIVFCPIRVVAEMMMREVRAQMQGSHFQKSGSISQSDIMSYRGGYNKADRRIIEKKMFDGQLRAIIATNALELGIDLSDLDVVITCGFPISKSNLHQQFGRAGRGKAATGSLAIFVPMRSPVDQYYIEHAAELAQNNYEDLCVDSLRDMEHASLILERHLQCAAYEIALDKDDDYQWFCKGRSLSSFHKILEQHLLFDVDGKYKTNPSYLPKPTKIVSIRAIDDSTVAIVDITNNRNIVLEEVELERTTWTIYEGGIFLHQGQPYLIKEFNAKERYCKVERVNVDWTTSQRDYTDVDPEEVELVKLIKPVNMKEQLDTPAFFGQIKVHMKVFGFFKVNRKEEILEVVEVKNPPVVTFNKGCWLNVPKSAIDIIRSKNLSPSGGIHAAAHGIMNMLPIYINSNKPGGVQALDFEMGTECKAPAKEFKATETRRKRPARLVFYDTKGNKHGSGYSYKTFECIDELIYSTFNRTKSCDCVWGCPLCVVGATCREQMRVMSRPAALIVLGSFMGLDLTKLAAKLPDGPEPGMPPVLHNTISDSTAAVRFSPNVKILESI